MKYLKTFEKLGVSYTIDDVTEELWEYTLDIVGDEIKECEFFYPVDKLPKEFTQGKPIKFFKVVINNQDINHMKVDFSKDLQSLEATMSLDPYSDNRISLMSHELLHLYQYIRQADMKKKKFYLKNSSLNNMYYSSIEHGEEFLDILKNVLEFTYISLEDEIHARTQECYRELIERKTTKENFKENLKKTDAWEYVNMYDQCFDKTMEIIYKNPIKWYKKLVYAWKNEKKKGLWSKIKTFFKDAQMSSIKVDKEEATALFKEIESFIHPQMKKYKRKLYRLYDNF